MFDFGATGQAVAQSETERAEHKRTELTGNPSRAKAPQNGLRAKASGVPQLAAVRSDLQNLLIFRHRDFRFR